MTTPDGRAVPPSALKATIEAADRAAARGAPGQALRLLLDVPPDGIAPDHDHTCPQCGEAWSHLDEPCGDLTAPILCGQCQEAPSGADVGAVDIEPDPIDHPW